MFFCQDVKIYNYQCTCECRNRNTKKPYSIKKSSHFITSCISEIVKKNQDNKSKDSLTLLERIRQRNKQGEVAKRSETIKKRDLPGNQRVNSLYDRNLKENIDCYELQSKNCGLNATYSKSILEKYNKLTNCGSEQNHCSIFDQNWKESQNFAIFPQQVLVTQSYKQNEQYNSQNFVQDESVLVQHNVKDNFIYIKCLESPSDFEESLAIEKRTGFLVSLKSVLQKQSEQKFYKELSVYSRIASHKNVIQLYQTCINKNNLMLIREPYSNTKPKTGNKHTLSQNITEALQFLEQQNIYMGPLHLSDIGELNGSWKISNFGQASNTRVFGIKENIRQLLQQIY